MYSEIASNKRRSVLFIGLFLAFWLVIGAALGLLFRSITRPPVNGLASTPPASGASWTPVVVGVVICAVLAALAILYSLTAGARLVLRTSGAKPADGSAYQQLNDLVAALAIGEGIPTPKVYVIDDPSPNAFATGVSPEKAAITFTTGLQI